MIRLNFEFIILGMHDMPEMVGPDSLAFVGPARVYLLDFFCSCVQFYLLLSPYFCLYLDLYVLGDDALIS